MSLANKVLASNNDLPIRSDQPVHSGKVRSVYWLTEADSRRLIADKGYDVAADAPLELWSSVTVYPPLNVSGKVKEA